MFKCSALTHDKSLSGLSHYLNMQGGGTISHKFFSYHEMTKKKDNVK